MNIGLQINKIMKSPISGKEMESKYIVDGFTYYIDETGSLFCGCLDQSNMVGGTGNRENNHAGRLSIIKNFGSKTILDYGCGRGDFVDFLNSQGISADGYDPYSDKYSSFPKKKYDAITMIEVIEHTCSPYKELDEIKSLLNPNGILFIETSFSNWVTLGHPYLNPNIGHSTIFSHNGLDLLMRSKGFNVGQHINQNIRIFTQSVS
jgi:hypothetical protein